MGVAHSVQKWRQAEYEEAIQHRLSVADTSNASVLAITTALIQVCDKTSSSCLLHDLHVALKNVSDERSKYLENSNIQGWVAFAFSSEENYGNSDDRSVVCEAGDRLEKLEVDPQQMRDYALKFAILLVYNRWLALKGRPYSPGRDRLFECLAGAIIQSSKIEHSSTNLAKIEMRHN